jgi:hypothetical protein
MRTHHAMMFAAPAARLFHTPPLGIPGILVGLVLIFLSFVVMRAAWQKFGSGHGLTGCCLWELSDDLMGCGTRLVGCGSLLALLALPLLAWIGWRHR